MGWYVNSFNYFGVFVGRMDEINSAIFLSFENTTEMIISITSIMCFWCGVIKIVKNTKILGFFDKILRPFINYFYKKTSQNSKDFIVINVFSNMIGIGNAATPAGIEAMKEMDKELKSEKMSPENELIYSYEYIISSNYSYNCNEYNDFLMEMLM